MREGFLCSYHRNKLAEDPEAALNLLLRGIAEGDYFNGQLRPDKAIPCYGGAFEAAELLFENPEISPSLAVGHLTTTTLALARALYEDGQPQQCRHTLQAARNRMDTRIREKSEFSPHTGFTRIALSILDSYYRKLFPVASTTTGTVSEFRREGMAASDSLH